MKTLLKYICIAAAVSLLAGCSKDELSIPGRAESIEFIMRPTSFNGLDASNVSTKALVQNDLEIIEDTIYSKNYIIFNADGTINNSGQLTVNQASVSITQNRGTGPFRICFFANIPSSYLRSIKNYSDLSSTPLQLEYADHEETGHIGIPVIDGNMCFPMYGEVVFPSADVTPVNNKVIVPLERLFAKVVLNLKAYFDASLGDSIFDSPDITIFSYSLNNLPNSVLLVAPSETPWWEYDNSDTYFNNYHDVDLYKDIEIDNSNILYNEFTHLEEFSPFYIPEYIIKPIKGAENETDQKLKPTLIDPDKRPVYLSMQAKAHQSNFVDVPLEYKIYLGGNAVNDFSLLRNTRYNNYMTITGTGEAVMGMDHRVEAGYFNLANPDNSGPDEPANCYIISKPGRYLIPMYKGNTTTQLTGVTQAETIDINGSSANTITDAQIVTRDGSEFVLFNANMPVSGGTITPTTVAGGNKLMTVKDQNGNILWSWHLWFCEDESRPDKEDFQHTYPGTEAIVMNRALGATTNIGIQQNLPLIGAINLTQWTDGFYYQWGRKDPMMPQTAQSNGSYAASIQNPRVFYSDWDADEAGWSTDSKTVNDPCPPGYKVPSNQIWRERESTSTGMEDIMEGLSNYISSFDGYPYNLGIGLDMSLNIVYPYKSYLVHSSGQLMPETNEEVHVTTSSWITDQTSIGNNQYRSSDFYLSYRNRPSFLWSANMETALNYSKRADNNSVKFVTGETRSRSTWFSSWSNWSNYNNQTISGNTVTDNFYNANPSKSLYSREYTELSPADGLMVRCVSENSPVQ